jgi:hypothetical protein
MYEIVLNYVAVNPKNGSDVSKKENLILEHAESFADAEQIGYDYGSGLTGIDVVSIKRSKLKEIVNEKPFNDETCKIYIAQIVDHFVDFETEETKDIKYSVALFAHDMNEAHKAIEQYIKQGLEDMDLVSIKETKYNGVLK